MISFLRERILLWLTLPVFILLKLPALQFPFYWDESWSYAPAVKLMYLHGPSLLPGCIPEFYSRGHPLLFYALAAGWMRIFGDSHVAQHCFSLTISIALLIAVFEVGMRLFNVRVAQIALLLVAGQVCFMVQSTMLLPEVMLALLTVLSLYFFVARKYVWLFLACSALVLTKESGMVLGLILGGAALVQLFSGKEPTPERLKLLAAVGGSGVVIGFFFLMQHATSGWYMYPQHTGLIKLDWTLFKGKMRFCFEIIFDQQYRWWVFSLFFAMCSVVAVKTKNWKPLIPLLAGVLVYVFIGDKFGYLSRKVYIPALFAMLGYIVYLFNAAIPQLTSKGKAFTSLAIAFFAAFLAFSSINFFTDRYLICAMVVLLVVLAVYIDYLATAIHKTMNIAIPLVIIVISTFALKCNKGLSDVNLGAYDAMSVQQQVVQYLEKQSAFDQPIYAHSFLNREHLTKPYTGFLNTPRVFTHVSDTTYPVPQWIIVDNIEIDTTFDVGKAVTGYQKIAAFGKGEAKADIYKRN